MIRNRKNLPHDFVLFNRENQRSILQMSFVTITDMYWVQIFYRISCFIMKWNKEETYMLHSSTTSMIVKTQSFGLWTATWTWVLSFCTLTVTPGFPQIRHYSPTEYHKCLNIFVVCWDSVYRSNFHRTLIITEAVVFKKDIAYQTT